MPDVIINADDYAMDAEVDAAILDLADRGIVTATSAMVLSPSWRASASRLRSAPLSAGLHLDLTSPFPKRCFPQQSLLRLIAISHARALDRQVLRKEIHSQLSVFEEGMSRPPDFVDGHQHVHHLPVVRAVLLEALVQRYGVGAKAVGLRICVARNWRGLKSAIIGGTGAYGLARDATALKSDHINTDFAGVYGFEPEARLSELWESWFRRLQGAMPVIMCHPAINLGSGDGSGDPIRPARYHEYQFLSSEAFLALRQRFSINPVRWPPTSSSRPQA